MKRSAIISTEHGMAVNTAFASVDIPWHVDFAQPVFTVELWAMPRLPREWLITCVYPPSAVGPLTGWGLEIGCQGELAARIVKRGEKNRVVWNRSLITEGQWHHLAMSYDGSSVRLYVDGVSSEQEENLSDPLPFNHEPGLRIGAQTSVVCESLIQEMRLSRGLRVPSGANLRMHDDDQTIGLWRIAEDGESLVQESISGAPAGVIHPFVTESLDAIEMRSFHAGPGPLDIPVQQTRCAIGSIAMNATHDVLSLNGSWQMLEGEYQPTNWADAISAVVPGSVHTALQSAGLIPDPKFGLNDSIAREQSFKTWWFRKTFRRPPGTGHRLVFDGVAIHCAIWLNGTKLGEHEGMFGGPNFDISHVLADENELLVRLDPAPTGPPWFAPTANTGWKKTVVFNNVYGWHYCHVPALGVWRSVRVEATPAVKINHPFVVTRDVSSGEISLRVDLVGVDEHWRGTLHGTITGENFDSPAIRFQVDVESTARTKSLHLQLTIPNPRSWWPNGLGDPNLYRLTLNFNLTDDEPVDHCTTTFGLRTIEMAPLPGGERPSLYNWTFIINGKPTFIKGAGWCTMDASMDFSPARYEHFLRLAKEQNCQMVRAWGSGMPETDEFYDLCDRLGLTVMQEWPTAWNSHDEQPFDALEETVRLNTLRLRNHPSLVMWGGGNESSAPFGKAIDMMGRCAIELDGTRPFHRGEPWGGSDHNYACWWGKVHLDNNLKINSRFFGEFGIASIPVYESVQKYLPEDERTLWPPKEDGAFAHHTPVFNTMEDMDRLRLYAGYFTAGDTMRRFIEASQIAQAVAVRHTLERARTRWPECTGSLMYKLNDNYPAASWSTVDWYGATKISHWVVQDAFAPLHACVLFDSLNNQGKALSLPVFLLDDADALKESQWRVNIRAYDGGLNVIQSQEFSGAESINRVRKVGEFKLTSQQTRSTPLLIVAEIKLNGSLIDRTFYFINCESKKDCLFNLPPTMLLMEVTNTGVIIKNTGDLPAVGVAIHRPGYSATFNSSDNYFWLAPGESKQVQVSATSGLQIRAWNSPLTNPTEPGRVGPSNLQTVNQ